MEPIRIGIVGLGGICRQRHLPGLRAIDGVEVVTVANRSPESSAAAAQEFGIPEINESWQELVTRDDLDAVLIGTWPYLHKAISVAALDAGKHVFCQARMAMDYPEAQAMHAKALETGLTAMLCPVPFGLSIDATIARFLGTGYLGQIRLVQVQSFTDAHASPDAPMNWRKDHRLSGLNMHTLGMYIEVIHRWFGWTRAVSAQSSIFVPERVDESGAMHTVTIPDQILCHATLRRDAIPVQYTFNAAVHHGHDQIMVYGEHATLRYDVFDDKLHAARPGEPLRPVAVRPEDAYDVKNWRVERDFIDAIRYGSEYHPNFEDGLRYMQVVQAIHDSAQLGKTVELD